MPRTVRLGAFVLGALVILAVGIFMIGNKEGLFTSGYTLQATFANVSGLQNGAEVRVGGIHEGTVKIIKLPTKPGEKIVVVMELAKITRSVIKKDSVGSIRTEGMVGAKFVEISFGSKDAPPVRDGDTIESEPPLDFSDLLKKTDTILDSTGSLTKNLDDTAKNLDMISAKINEGHGTLGALVNDKRIYKELNATTTEAAAGAASFKDNMDALHHNFFLRGFFKKRGYEDASDLTAHAIEGLPQEAPMKKFTYDAKQLFGKKDGVKLHSKEVLEEAGRFLETNKFGTAVVVGYTGAKGDSEENKTLTEARAMIVRDYLAKNFKMDDTLVKTLGLGENTPAGTKVAGGIEVLIYPPGSSAPYARK